MTQLKIGLFIGDSILHEYFPKDPLLCSKIKQQFDLDVVTTDFRPGKTTNFLVHKVFPWQMAEFVNRHDCDIMVDVFLISGAVDLSDSIPETLHFDLEDFLTRRNADFKAVLDHPFVRRLFVYPLTPRRICKNDLCDRFPKYANHSWILLANRCVNDINQSNLNFHSKLRHIPPLPTNQISKHVAKDGIHLVPKGKEAYAWSVLQVCEQKIFLKDEFPPLKHAICETSPLQSIDMQIAIFEAKKRQEKKKNQAANLIDTRSEKIQEDKFVHFEKRMHIKCTPSCKERKMFKLREVSIKVVTAKKEKKRSRAKEEVLQKSFDCLPVDAFINQNQSKKCKNGEDKQIDRMVRNILRKRSEFAPPSMNFFDCENYSSKLSV